MKQEMLEKLLEIPPGQVTTYAELARYFGTSPRAIASMLASNIELDRYPCYKVIHTDGRVGGYRGGVNDKVMRLQKEGISIQNGKIDLSKYGFQFRAV